MIDLFELDRSEFICTDRWRFKVHILGPDEEYTGHPQGTSYIMMQDATYKSYNGEVSAAAAAIQAVDKFELITNPLGSAVVIEYGGLSLNEEKIFIPKGFPTGSLSYMDGGTNTTAISPGRLGDPVINYVHFPAQMFQTLHTHPSQRVGFIISGNGNVVLKDDEFFKLKEGRAFFLDRNELHNFVCDEKDVVLFVWAPDSGDGPTDEINPLKVRTYVKRQT